MTDASLFAVILVRVPHINIVDTLVPCYGRLVPTLGLLVIAMARYSSVACLFARASLLLSKLLDGTARFSPLEVFAVLRRSVVVCKRSVAASDGVSVYESVLVDDYLIARWV